MLQYNTETRKDGTSDHMPNALVGHRSRKRISDFRLHQPTTVEEAWALWSHGGPFCALMAGGIDLINDLKNGCHVGDLIALGQLTDLKGFRVSADNITLGALTSHHDLGAADLPTPFDALSKIWRTIANPRVRFKGTLGGNILANPNYEAAPCLEALGASTKGRLKDGTIVRLSPCAAASYGKEILLSEIVISRKATAFVYERGERPVASVALAVFGDAYQGSHMRIAVGCAFDRTVVVELELPSGFALSDDTDAKNALITRLMANLPVARSDVNASGRYRLHLIGILTARAIDKLGGACL